MPYNQNYNQFIKNKPNAYVIVKILFVHRNVKILKIVFHVIKKTVLINYSTDVKIEITNQYNIYI